MRGAISLQKSPKNAGRVRCVQSIKIKIAKIQEKSDVMKKSTNKLDF
jgi:hypothetical protein